GTWEQKTGTDRYGYHATMTIGNITYKGVFFKQFDESAEHNEVMTFSLIGDDNRSIWGSKIN
ncbi:MAG: glycoside hydrolase family 43 protein, partial [Lachnospiraceae bacterium]|nr:glycoside hydrolase family 43 protein [Lachnospiraceae bacterium]